MKKFVALLLAALMLMGCVALAENVKMDKLTFQFVPSKDADVIITGTKNLPELVKAEMATLGYDIGEVEISVSTSYEACGEAMCAGAIDIGWLPGGTYAIYSQAKEVDVILTATRAGLSNDSTDPATWNGDANKYSTSPAPTFMLPSRFCRSMTDIIPVSSPAPVSITPLTLPAASSIALCASIESIIPVQRITGKKNIARNTVLPAIF